LGKDERSRSLLNQLPKLLEEQLQAGRGTVGEEKFLPWLEERFRNSVHVSAVTERTEDIQLPDLVAKLAGLYETELGKSVDRQRTQHRQTVPEVHFGPLVPQRQAPVAARA
jgi:hypothetical protein